MKTLETKVTLAILIIALLIMFLAVVFNYYNDLRILHQQTDQAIQSQRSVEDQLRVINEEVKGIKKRLIKLETIFREDYDRHYSIQ